MIWNYCVLNPGAKTVIYRQKVPERTVLEWRKDKTHFAIVDQPDLVIFVLDSGTLYSGTLCFFWR